LRCLGNGQTESDILAHRHMRENRIGLENHRDTTV
jgi:hypothetical protein